MIPVPYLPVIVIIYIAYYLSFLVLWNIYYSGTHPCDCVDTNQPNVYLCLCTCLTLTAQNILTSGDDNDMPLICYKHTGSLFQLILETTQNSFFRCLLRDIKSKQLMMTMLREFGFHCERNSRNCCMFGKITS